MKANDSWFIVIGLGLLSEIGLNIFLGYNVVSTHHIDTSMFYLIASLVVFTTILLLVSSYAIFVLRAELRQAVVNRDVAELQLARAQYQSSTRHKDASMKVAAMSRQLIKSKTSLINGSS